MRAAVLFHEVSVDTAQCAQIGKNWKKLHILTKNWSFRLILGSLEAKSEDLSEKSRKIQKVHFSGGLGPNFHIWA